MSLTRIPGSFLANNNVTFANGTFTNANLGNLASANFINGTLRTNAQPNITSVGTLANLTVTGNVTAAYIVGNGSQLTGLPESYANSNVASYLPTYTGNLTAGNANLGNAVSAAYIVGNGSQLTGLPESYANSNVASYLPTHTGNLTAGNANLGNAVTANYFIGNGSQLTGLPESYANSNVANYLPTYTGNLTAGNANLGNAVSANYFVGNGSQLTGLPASYANSNVASYLPTYTGNLTAGNANLGNLATSNFFSGSGNLLSNIQASNITGTIANATHAISSDTANSVAGSNVSGQVANALIAGTVYTAAQPNITSVGTLTSVSITGNVTAGNASLGNLATANFFSGSGNLLSNIQASNITGTIANATYAANAGNATSATTASTVTTAAQPNITSVGTLSSLAVTGNANVGNLGVNTDLIVGGNLTVNGTTTTVNSTTTSVVDPIIELGGGSNGAALTTSDSKDRGQLLHYYSGSAIDAFMGWDSSNAEFAFGSNVSVSSEVVTFNTFGNIRAGNANLGNLITANFFSGNGSLLSAIAFGNITTFNTAGLTTDELYLQSTTRLNVTASGTSGYIFDQYGASTVNPVIYVTSGQTLAFNLDVSGHPFLIQTSGGANYNVGLEYVDTTGTVSTTSSAQGKISGTLYWKIPYGITGNYKYQCSIHGGMNGNIVVSDANIANITVGSASSATTATTATTAGTVTTAAQPNITSHGTLTSLTSTGTVDLTGASNVSLGPVGNVKVTGGTSGYVLSTDGAGNLSWVVQSGGTAAAISNGTSNVNVASSGNVTVGVSGNASIVTVTGTGANIAGYANVTGNLNVGAISNLGPVGNVKITGGTSGYVLSTDGVGNLSWAAQSGGGGGSGYTAATTPPGSSDPGDLWYNTSTNVLYEYIFDGTSSYWVDMTTPTTSAATTTTYVTRSYTGDGSTTNYTVTQGCDVNNILVFLNGICQMPTTDYTVSGTVLTLIPAADSGMSIQVRELPR